MLKRNRPADYTGATQRLNRVDPDQAAAHMLPGPVGSRSWLFNELQLLLAAVALLLSLMLLAIIPVLTHHAGLRPRELLFMLFWMLHSVLHFVRALRKGTRRSRLLFMTCEALLLAGTVVLCWLAR